MLQNSVDPTWLIVGAIVIIILIILVVLINSNNRNIFINKGSIQGNVTYNPTINNTTTINTYIQTGEPSSSKKQKKSFTANLADSIINIPSSIFNELTKASSSGNDTASQIGGLLLLIIGFVIIFSIGFVITKGIIFVAMIISSLSIIYYLYLSLLKKEPVSLKLYLLQIIYLVRMFFLTIPISPYAEQIQFNSLNKTSFSFWINQFKTFNDTHSIQTASLLILAVLYLIVSYFQLYSNLAITAERKSITWKSVVISVLTTVFLIVISFNIESLYVLFNELTNTFRSSIGG